MAKNDKKVKKVEQEEVRVIRTIPRNLFDPKKWPSTMNYFRNATGWQLYQPEDGKKPYYEFTGFENGDYPAYIPESYCEKRVGKELGLRPEDNMIAIAGDYGKVWLPIFKSDKHDNIEILFYSLDRELFPLDAKFRMGTTEQMQDNKKDAGYFHRTRLNPQSVTDDCKYLSPEKKQSGESHPFIPPQIIEAWEKGEEIETLVITEGEFKAMKACMCGGHVIGIGGIQMFYNTATREIFRDVLRVIQDCKVKNLIFLHDGDCTDLSKKALQSHDSAGQPDKDLAERPRDFLNSAREFYRIHHKAMPKVKIYWQYINSKALPNQPKGLDDLLNEMPNEQQRIIHEMEDVDSITVFFHRVNMSSEYQKLADDFFLDSVKSFYKRHKDEIDPEPEEGKTKVYHTFLWMGTIYRWNPAKNEVEEVLSRDMMVYKRIGTSWYKEVKKPTIGRDKKGNIIMAEVLLPWSRQNITDDYGTEGLSKLHRYDGFVNLPSHDDYQRIIRNFYNLYRPLTYQPNEQDLEEHGFPHIMSTIEHIFGQDNKGRGLKKGDEGYDESSQFELGCDYMQLLYHQPTQNLPILCLVSSERGTGKTSFLDLTQVMFSDNTVIVGNEQITSNFNTLVAGRLIVGVDESSLADNKKFTEQLKMWSTSKMQSVEGKGKDAYQIENFTKYILCSNNERRFIYASDEEVRFWVRKVPKLPEGTKIGNIKPFYEQEMPAFLAWLNKRTMYYAPDDPKKIDRMYFPPELLHTKWLDELLEAQRPRPEKKMREWLKQWFIDFGREELLCTADKLQEAIGKTDRKFLTYDLDDIKRYIEENMHVGKFGGGSGKSKRFHFEIVSNYVPDSDKDSELFTKEKIVGNGRPYQFLAKDFMTLQEYYDLFPDRKPKTQEPELPLKG